MASQETAPLAVTLDNCAREPIHIPAQIQPDGVLLAFDTGGTLVAWSANAAEALSLTPHPGVALADLPLPAEVRSLVEGCLTAMHRGDVVPEALETAVVDRDVDCVVHAHAGRAILEIMWRAQKVDEIAAFALKAHRAIDRLKRQRNTIELLELAVREIQALTGFDRVMAYRFRHDDSGEIVAEAAVPSLEPFLGRRYPASDIPAQARRLYTLNTLRLISDINYKPVPLVSWTDAPLDMSHCVLRSVSPIHIEYLQNMKVGASMSVSIVVEGRLWGMLACHHMSARKVPFSVRMACDVLAQVMAANIHASDARARAAEAEKAASIRTRLVETLVQEEDVLRGIALHATDLCESLKCDALIASQFGKVVVSGGIDEALATNIVATLNDEALPLVHRSAITEWPESVQGQLSGWVGCLGLRFDPPTRGCLIALRREQIETIRWGGKPEKEYTVGPLGPRLTPRGSFEEYREIVRGSAEPWNESQLVNARQLLAEMQRISNARHAELEKIRAQLLAMLGHDLRDPLQSIAMAAAVLQRGAPAQSLTRRIQASSGRMQRLIGMALDMSRIESGMGLGMKMSDTDLVKVVSDLLDEARVAHPGVTYVSHLPDSLLAVADSNRISQVISNLVSNARHHGEPGQPVTIDLTSNNDTVSIQVRNVGEPIPEARVGSLFSAFKDHARRNERNPGGLGLGLHIAQEIAREHGGTIRYDYAAPHVVFTVEFPARRSQ